MGAAVARSPRRWSRCWACSRRAAPTCRSTPPPRRAHRLPAGRPGRRALVDPGGRARLPLPAGVACASSRTPLAGGEPAPTGGAGPESACLRHLHLGLDRAAQGRGRRPRASSPTTRRRRRRPGPAGGDQLHARSSFAADLGPRRASPRCPRAARGDDLWSAVRDPEEFAAPAAASGRRTQDPAFVPGALLARPRPAAALPVRACAVGGEALARAARPVRGSSAPAARCSTATAPPRPRSAPWPARWRRLHGPLPPRRGRWRGRRVRARRRG